MLNTRFINRWLGSSYSVEEIAGWDPAELGVFLEVLLAMDRGLNPPPPESGK